MQTENYGSFRNSICQLDDRILKKKTNFSSLCYFLLPTIKNVAMECCCYYNNGMEEDYSMHKKRKVFAEDEILELD